jgi:hypothetical protein
LQSPKCRGSATNSFTVVAFTKPRTLCWRHACPDNTLWQMQEPFRWLWKSRTLFCFLARNVNCEQKGTE